MVYTRSLNADNLPALRQTNRQRGHSLSSPPSNLRWPRRCRRWWNGEEPPPRGSVASCPPSRKRRLRSTRQLCGHPIVQQTSVKHQGQRTTFKCTAEGKLSGSTEISSLVQTPWVSRAVTTSYLSSSIMMYRVQSPVTFPHIHRFRAAKFCVRSRGLLAPINTV